MNTVLFRDNPLLASILGEISSYYMNKTNCPTAREQLQATAVYLMSKSIPDTLSKQTMDTAPHQLSMWVKRVLSGEPDTGFIDTDVPPHVRSTVNHLRALFFTFHRFERWRGYKTSSRESRLHQVYAIESECMGETQNTRAGADELATNRAPGLLRRLLSELSPEASVELDSWIQIRNAAATSNDKNRRAQLFKQARKSLHPCVVVFIRRIITETNIVPEEDLGWFVEVCVGCDSQKEIADRHHLPASTLSRKKSLYLQELFHEWTRAKPEGGNRVQENKKQFQAGRSSDATPTSLQEANRK